MTINPKRNYACCYDRQSFARKENKFSVYGVQMKCVRSDECSQTITLHYLNNGKVKLRVVINKKEQLIPLIIIYKALYNLTDFDIFNLICSKYDKIKSFHDRIEIMLNEGLDMNINSQRDAIEYLGRNYKYVMNYDRELSD